jgi:hypothetical protein
MSASTLLLAFAAVVAVAVAGVVAQLLKSWMKKRGSNIEIRVGDRVVSTIQVAGDQSEISKRIQDELVKDEQIQALKARSS